MTPIFASRPNVYTGSPLDRVAPRRNDAAWIEAVLEDPTSLFVPVWRGRVLVRGAAEARPEAVFPAGSAGPALRAVATSWVLLGIWHERAAFAVDLSEMEDPAPLLANLPDQDGAFEDMRSLAGSLSAEEAAVLAHAKGLLHWRARHRFCGVCGGACEPQSAGNVMACTQCGTHHFPRTDPAVIMLVTRGDRVLLGHSQRFPRATMYSTLAGFVEPGESLEEAVAREVAEETGVRVGRVHYHSSQPWPFPASVMLGFYAEGLSEEITIDPAELSDARWFTRAQLSQPEAHGFSLPRPDSIARRLIEDWMAAG
jgi:NAD+ diphosphatase